MMRSHYWIALGVITTSLVFGYTIFSPSALPKLWQMRLKVDSLHSRVLSLHEKIAELSEEVELLSQDSMRAMGLIEEIAREELGMIGPGEVLYKVGEHRTPKERTKTHEKDLYP